MDGAKDFLKAQQNATQEAEQQSDIFTLSCSIAKLSDADLAEIFKRLPPYDRLRVSEVCTRWRDVSRKTWLDVTQLDLSPIPGARIDAVISQCPNLRTVFARQRTFASSDLSCLSRLRLSSVSFTNCTIVGAATFPDRVMYGAPPLVRIFGDAAGGHLSELALNNVALRFANAPVVLFTASGLRRLQLTGMDQLNDGGRSSIEFPSDELTHAIYLCDASAPFRLWNADSWNPPGVGYDPLRGLLELFLAPLERRITQIILSDVLCGSQTTLQVLFLHQIWRSDKWSLRRLVTEHPTLRILVLTGASGEESWPLHASETVLPRRLFNPAGKAYSLRHLCVFVGKGASETIFFTESESLKVYPIDEPLPKFLARPDVATIFEGVWIAEKIKEAAKRGDNWFDYASDLTTEYCVVPNQQ